MTDAEPTTRWQAGAGASYAARFRELAGSGVDVHGEASLCASLVPAGSRVLDAGCGTGRVAARLAELGFDCVGVDVDSSMLAEARRASSAVRWVQADLAELAGLSLGAFDLVVAAGNVVPLLGAGRERAAVAAMADRVAPGGLLVAGYGLHPATLPPAAVVVAPADYDSWCGLRPLHRWSTWDREPYTDDARYLVSVHTR